MMNQRKPVRFILIFAGIILFIILLMQPIEVWHFKSYIDILFPKGKIAFQQRNLLLIIQVLMLFVVIPVYVLTFLFSWRYRAQNTKAKYAPEWDDHRLAEYIWWGIPCLLVLIIGTLTWIRTYEMDPFKPLHADQKGMKIQVVALQWKWLFIYPEQKIATVNFVQFPVSTPIQFEITADAPMNSFWIPQLGGQIYAMPKMKTMLNLIADEIGDFKGASANLSGVGFAGMTFTARASQEADFQQWVHTVQQSSNSLTSENYRQLALPSQNNPVETYQLKEDHLFDAILMKYMQPVKE
jgi:cytochrome o ubiquinol oxidase subunit II